MATGDPESSSCAPFPTRPRRLRRDTSRETPADGERGRERDGGGRGHLRPFGGLRGQARGDGRGHLAVEHLALVFVARRRDPPSRRRRRRNDDGRVRRRRRVRVRVPAGGSARPRRIPPRFASRRARRRRSRRCRTPRARTSAWGPRARARRFCRTGRRAGLRLFSPTRIMLARLARVRRRRRGPRPQAASGIILGRVRIRGRREVVRAAAAAERGGPRARREARALGEPAGVGGGAVGVSRAIIVGVQARARRFETRLLPRGGRAPHASAAAAAGDLERARSRRGGGAVAGAAVAVAAAVRPARVLRVERGARRAAHGEGRGPAPPGEEAP